MTQQIYRNPDADACRLTRDMLSEMRYAVLAVTMPNGHYPHVSRIAAQVAQDGTPTALLSEIATHTRYLEESPRASILVERAFAQGDAMAQPRMSLQIVARRLRRDDDAHHRLLDLWLDRHPKAKVYAMLPDFHFWRLEPHGGLLNAGFGESCILRPRDLKLTDEQDRE